MGDDLALGEGHGDVPLHADGLPLLQVVIPHPIRPSPRTASIFILFDFIDWSEII
jgi:hypothetical protein